jgi:hypothetical protein
MVFGFGRHFLRLPYNATRSAPRAAKIPSFNTFSPNRGPQHSWRRSFCCCPGCGPRGHHGGWKKHETQAIPRSILRGNRPQQKFLISTIAILSPSWNSSVTWRDNRRKCLVAVQNCDAWHQELLNNRRALSTSRKNDYPLPLGAIPGWPILAGFLKVCASTILLYMTGRLNAILPSRAEC